MIHVYVVVVIIKKKWSSSTTTLSLANMAINGWIFLLKTLPYGQKYNGLLRGEN